MNAPHPFRAQHGHLTVVAPPLQAPVTDVVGDFERAHAVGELSAGISGLDSLIESLHIMAWHVERAVERGAGQSYDLDKLERIKGRLAEVHQKLDLSAGRLTAKLAGAR